MRNIRKDLETAALSGETIDRILTSTIPVRIIDPIIRGSKETAELSRKSCKTISSIDENGIFALAETDETREAIILQIAQNKFLSNASYVADMASGLYYLATTKAQQSGVEWIIEGNYSIVLLLDITAILRATFGAMVDRKGRAIWGAGDAIKQAMKTLRPLIAKETPPPVVTVRYPDPDSPGDFKCIIGEPIRILGTIKNKEGKVEKVAVELSNYFFPVQITGGEWTEPITLKAEGQYLHQVAGLHTLMDIGRQRLIQELESKGLSTERIPTALTAKKFILAAQGVYNLRGLFPNLVSTNRRNRKNIMVRRSFLKAAAPHLVSGGNKGTWIDYKQASNYISLIGQMYHQGIIAADILDDIIHDPNIVMIATEAAAEFPRDLPNTFFIKADRA